MNYGRFAAIFGAPTAIGIAAGMELHSVLLGILIGVAACIAIVVVIAKRNPPPAWEAKLTLDPLGKTIASRVEQTKTASPGELPKRLREIDFLKRQYEDLVAIVERNDMSPGRGYIGFDAYSGE